MNSPIISNYVRLHSSLDWTHNFPRLRGHRVSVAFQSLLLDCTHVSFLSIRSTSWMNCRWMTPLKWSKWSKVTLAPLTSKLLTLTTGADRGCQVSYVLCQQIQLCGRRDRYMTSDFESFDALNKWLWIKSVQRWDLSLGRNFNISEVYTFEIFFIILPVWSISHSPTKSYHVICWSCFILSDLQRRDPNAKLRHMTSYRPL